MSRLGRGALLVGGLAALAVGVWILVKVEQIAERVSVRPLTVDQMREIVLDAMGKEAAMVQTPVTDKHNRTHQVRTVFRESGSEDETEDQFIQRHIDRCRKVKAAWDAVPP